MTGGFLGKGFGGYHLPCAADIPAIEVEFAAERDPHASPLGARGVGEIGTIGVGAAVANAIFNATGQRHRQLPIEPAQVVPVPTLDTSNRPMVLASEPNQISFVRGS